MTQSDTLGHLKFVLQPSGCKKAFSYHKKLAVGQVGRRKPEQCDTCLSMQMRSSLHDDDDQSVLPETNFDRLFLWGL